VRNASRFDVSVIAVNDFDDERSVAIRSCHGRRSLRFHSQRGDYFQASVAGDGPTGSVLVWGYTDCELLVDLFESIARDWRGWDGKRRWSSIEGELNVAASTTKTGNVTLSVELVHSGGVDEWRLIVPIFTEAGQLERIAREVASFFRGWPGQVP
jgi:hypothetical protein